MLVATFTKSFRFSLNARSYDRTSTNLRLLRCVAISVGCGSFEVSWLRCEDMAVAVFGVVDAFVLAAEVEAPVVLEVAGGDEGAAFRRLSASPCSQNSRSISHR